jgi:hypothetical protein
MSEPLRPFTLGEILDRTAQLYRRNFVLFAGVAAVPSAAIISACAPTIVLFALLGRAVVRSAAPPNVAIALPLAAAVLVAMVVAVGATVVSQAALVRACINTHMGRTLKMRDALKSVWPRLWQYVRVLCLQGVFAFLIPAAIAGGAIAAVFLLARLAGGGIGPNAIAGFLAFLIVAAAFVAIVLRALTYSLALPACVAEEKPAWESLQRSVKLSKGTRGRIFLMFLLVWALSVIVSIIGYIPMVILTAVITATGHGGAQFVGILLVASEILNMLINFAVQIFITPVYVVALVLFYFDQRIRTEGFDIEWMMERAGLTGTANASGQGTISSGQAPDPGTVNG